MCSTCCLHSDIACLFIIYLLLNCQEYASHVTQRTTTPTQEVDAVQEANVASRLVTLTDDVLRSLRGEIKAEVPSVAVKNDSVVEWTQRRASLVGEGGWEVRSRIWGQDK